jgi:tripartite-type tricarboxylate transporter receptor subunit TctC
MTPATNLHSIALRQSGGGLDVSLQMYGLRPLAFFLIAPLLPVAPTGAQESIEQFYRGKTVNIVVGSAVGGGFDGYARMVARYLGKHVPGNPVIVVQNMPGAGSNKAASFVALQAPKDGTTIGAIQPSAVVQPLVSDQAVPHDPNKFIMLGSGSYSVYLCMLRSDAPAKTFEETFTKEVIIGTSGEGSTLREMAVLLTNVLGAKLRLVSGYAGSREVLIAIERNEVHGICGMGWSSISMQQRDWIRNGTLRIIAQEDLKGHPEVNKMGVPLTISFARTEEEIVRSWR